MFKKILAKVGIGNAEVDTRLDNAIIEPGGTLTGTIHLRGGSTEQKIDKFYLSLVANVKYQVEDAIGYKLVPFMHYDIDSSFTIGINEEIEIPISLSIPNDVPITTFGKEVLNPNHHISIRTGVDIESAVDPTDLDHISVQPTPLMTMFFEAMEKMGFRLYKTDIEEGRIKGSKLPFYQEFEYHPPYGAYEGKIREVELTFIPKGDGYSVIFEVDKSKGLFNSETLVSIEFDKNTSNFEEIIPKIETTILSLL
ncbi:MAG: sporulation protein [Candidatus Kapabacteria bacterium]|jgi:sporulation-control protein|nr:sporulation protein [Candidatus Kapabacteria bacterium]